MIILKPKQERFCQEYVIDLNGTQAAIRAGYSSKTANEKAAQLLAIVSIQRRIAELQAEIAERNRLKADDIINELRKLAFWNIKDFVTETNDIKLLNSLQADISCAVSGIKVKKVVLRAEGVTIGEEITTELKLTDKRAALVDLGRHIGIFEKDNNQKAIKIKVVRK